MDLCIQNSGAPFSKVDQLSQLSTRLWKIYNSSCALARTAELSYAAPRNPQGPLFDDACYGVVAAWFVHLFARMQLQVPLVSDGSPSGTGLNGEILQSIFSASHYLLDILRLLQRELDAPTTPEAGLWTGLSPGLVHSAQVSNEHISGYFNQTGNIPSHSNDPSNCPSSMIRHLVIACHTQILNIHVTVLVALQHDAVLKNPHFSTEGHVEDDTRLALVVQLCAYLLERQRQAVHLFLVQVPPSPTQVYGTHGGTTSSMSNQAMMGHLEVDVQHRLARIQQMLRI